MCGLKVQHEFIYLSHIQAHLHSKLGWCSEYYSVKVLTSFNDTSLFSLNDVSPNEKKCRAFFT